MHFIHDLIYCTSARQQFAVIHNTMFNSKLTIQLVPIIFVQFAYTRILTIVFPSHACHSNARWETWYVLKTYTVKQSRHVDIRINCIFLTISMWYKQTVINTHIYTLEIIALFAISGLTDIVKIVPSVYQGNECIYLDIHVIVFA